jgi:hypothetical protein
LEAGGGCYIVFIAATITNEQGVRWPKSIHISLPFLALDIKSPGKMGLSPSLNEVRGVREVRKAGHGALFHLSRAVNGEERLLASDRKRIKKERLDQSHIDRPIAPRPSRQACNKKVIILVSSQPAERSMTLSLTVTRVCTYLVISRPSNT